MDGWEALLSIYQTASAERQALDEVVPATCPHDGEPLREDPKGNLRCPFDGWVWDGQPIRY